MATTIPVDVVTLLAPGQSIPRIVRDSLRRQGCLTIRHFLVEGAREAGESRRSAITRARNSARNVGSAHFVMFLDSDVLLPDSGIRRLLYGLLFNPYHAALGINYQTPAMKSPAPHIAMGAVLFHREVLRQIGFRSSPDQCECACCCADIRASGWEIDYIPGLRASHLRS